MKIKCAQCGKEVKNEDDHVIGYMARGRITNIFDCDNAEINKKVISPKYFKNINKKVKKCASSKK